MGNCMNNVGNDAKRLEEAARMDSDDDDIKYPDINLYTVWQALSFQCTRLTMPSFLEKDNA